ncbi:hypothetical protein [Elizabethkingia anophelis]|uniref:hypothetical protein n=1 Tax=Elizabethkingia anophelis TaxID=1117645 RepID=UPI0023E97511|nr:hypothetical protein [Elizabethkingia anophelis]GJN60481.1 hypothetical protein ELAK_06310 [Elizabethkingia anophelis]HDP3253992.1 hypothetical protein [Elizabethkingia anophelis]
MNPAELRVGNYVETKNGIKVVSQVTVDSHCYFLEDHVKPINVTKEWLLNLGFIDYVLEYYDELMYRKGDFILDEQFILMNIDIKIEVKHVHQLQNLYYALTGEDLKL